MKPNLLIFSLFNFKEILLIFLSCVFFVRLKVFGAPELFRKVLALDRLRASEHQAIQVISRRGGTFGG